MACRRKGLLAFAKYTGPLCKKALEALRPRVVQASSGASCLVIRVDQSLCLLGGAPDVSGSHGLVVPAAVIVRPDQYDEWSAYAQAMARAEIIRVVFPLSELEMCRQWVGLQLSQQSLRQ